MKRRIEALERTTAEETARWLQSLSDEALRAFAGPISLEEQTFLNSLTDEELEDLLAGRWPVQGGV
jgi:hypothetical protein